MHRLGTGVVIVNPMEAELRERFDAMVKKGLSVPDAALETFKTFRKAGARNVDEAFVEYLSEGTVEWPNRKVYDPQLTVKGRDLKHREATAKKTPAKKSA